MDAVTQDDSMLDDTPANTATTTEIETPEGTTITETTQVGDEPDSPEDDLDPDDDAGEGSDDE